MWKTWRLLTAGVVFALAIFVPAKILHPLDVQGATSVNVIVTWAPVAAPVNFDAWYIDDYTVGAEWVMPVGAVAAILKASDNAYPAGVDDGYTVYVGADTDTEDTAVNYYESLGPKYYAIWFYDDEDNLLPETYTDQVEGEAVSDLVDLLTLYLNTILPQWLGFLFLVTLCGLAYWKDSLLVYCLLCPAGMTYGLFMASVATENYQWVFGVVSAVMGTVALFRAVAMGIRRVRTR